MDTRIGRGSALQPRLVALAAASALAVSLSAPVGAITGDWHEDFDHPFVGVVLIWHLDESGNPDFGVKCSGSLVAPTVFVTAGHCTQFASGFAPGETKAYVWFEQAAMPSGTWPDPDTGFGLECAAGTLGVLCATGTRMYDYGFGDVNSKTDYHDVGVIILDQAISLPKYGTLPAPHALDALAQARGTQEATFTVSGYGASYLAGGMSWLHGRSNVDAAFQRRLEATAQLVSFQDAFTSDWGLLIEGNGLNSGSTCFGDSGGPLFWPPASNQISAIHSFGLGNNNTCKAVSGEYRLDQQAVIDWILDKAGDAAAEIVVGG